MMLLASFLILISVGGSYGTDQDCLLRKVRNCERILLQIEYPETAEGLKQACSDMQFFGSCLARAGEACDLNNDIIPPNIREAVNYLKLTCEMDTSTFKALADNLQCVTKVFKTVQGDCLQSFSNSSKSKLLEQFRDLQETEAFENSPRGFSKCVFDSMQIFCHGMKYGHHCGEEVKDAVEDILKNISPVKVECTPEILNELESFFEVFKEVLSHEKSLETALDK